MCIARRGFGAWARTRNTTYLLGDLIERNRAGWAVGHAAQWLPVDRDRVDLVRYRGHVHVILVVLGGLRGEIRSSLTKLTHKLTFLQQGWKRKSWKSLTGDRRPRRIARSVSCRSCTGCR